MDSPEGMTVMQSIEDETGARPNSTQDPASRIAPRQIPGDGKIYANTNAVLLEPTARQVLSQGMPPLSDALNVCPDHREAIEGGNETPVRQSFLKHRLLVPMCANCSALRLLEDFNLDPTREHSYYLDTCICCANILDGHACAWCNLQHADDLATLYLDVCYKFDKQGKGALLCACGEYPELPGEEIIRLCPVCHGVVSCDPLPHALDGITHLYPRSLNSTVSGVERVKSEHECTHAHPVKPAGAWIPIHVSKELQAAFPDVKVSNQVQPYRSAATPEQVNGSPQSAFLSGVQSPATPEQQRSSTPYYTPPQHEHGSSIFNSP